jgi:hypothetical protein
MESLTSGEANPREERLTWGSKKFDEVIVLLLTFSGVDIYRF